MINETEAEELRTLIRSTAFQLRRLGCVREETMRDVDRFVVWLPIPNDGVYDFRFPDKSQMTTIKDETLVQALARKVALLHAIDGVPVHDLPAIADLVSRFAEIVMIREARAREQVATAKESLHARIEDLSSRDVVTLKKASERCKQCGSTLDARGLCEDQTCPHAEWTQDIDMKNDFDDEGKLKDPTKVRFRQWP